MDSRENGFYCYCSLIVFAGIIAEGSTYGQHLLKHLNGEYHFKPHCQLMAAKLTEEAAGWRLMGVNKGREGLLLTLGDNETRRTQRSERGRESVVENLA